MTTNATAGRGLCGRPGIPTIPHLEQTMTTDPTADRAALRERIAEALRPGSRDRSGQYPEGLMRDVNAVLAVLPEPTSRAAVLLDAAALLDQRATGIDAFASSDYGPEAEAVRALADAANELRRLATEAQQQEEPEPCSGCLLVPCGACPYLKARREAEAKAQQQPTDEDAVEAHRLALSFALDLGNGAPWQAILERAGDLSRRDVEAQQQPDTETPVVDRAAVLREAADDLATAFGDPMVKHIGAIAASHLRRRAREIEAGETGEEQPETAGDEEARAVDVESLAQLLSAADVHVNHGDYPSWDDLAGSGVEQYRTCARWLLKRLHITHRVEAPRP